MNRKASSAKIKGISIDYPNRTEFLQLKREIFTDEIYAIELKSENPLIIDIGAHVGLASLYFHLNHPDSEIISYEPNPILFSYLQANLSQFSNIQTNNLGVTKRGGKQTLYISDREWYSNSSFLEGSWNGAIRAEKEDVQTVSFESIVKNRKSIDLIKIDVEGLEYSLLNDTSILNNVENLIIEVHPTELNRLKKMMKNLKNGGYQLSFTINGNQHESPPNGELFIMRCTRE